MVNFDHHSGKHMEIDGARIYVESIGNPNNPVLLVLHGGFGNIEDFNSLISGIEQEFRFIGIDCRGQGKSTLGTKALTYEQIQKDVKHVLEQLEIDTLSIMGFSDGGIVAYRLAALTSLNIEKLVTISADWHSKSIELNREIYSKITGERWRKKFPDTYESYQRQNPEPDFNLLTQHMVKMWLDTSSSGFPDEAVKSISSPLLIIRGNDDHLVSKEAVVELSELVKNSKLLNIALAGHEPFVDQKESFLAGLNNFLAT